jgi:hypothetical protein
VHDADSVRDVLVLQGGAMTVFKVAMRDAAVNAEASLFGLDRSCYVRKDVGDLRLRVADLRAMTVEEIESALLGAATDWEYLLP